MKSPRVVTFLNLFAEQRTVQVETESHIEFKATFSAPLITLPEAQKLKDVFETFPKRDAVSLSVEIDGQATTITFGDLTAIDVQLGELRNRLEAAGDGAAYSLNLTISKRREASQVTLYSPPLFFTHLGSCSFRDRLGIFNEFISETGTVKIACDEPVQRFGSQTIQFVTDGQPTTSHKALDRKSILAKRVDVAYFMNGADYQLVPEDFNLIETGTDEKWQGLFAELTNLLTIAFTADYTTFTNDKLDFKINGYKTLTGSFAPGDLVGANWAAAFKIYHWTYQGGSISDKVGLLRNVLSLNLDNNGRPLYNEDVYKSVQSGFAIYLKRNVAQYIELKNKLAEFLQTLSNQAAGDVDKCTDALRGALGALITFFISTMILSAIAGRGLSGIFTTDITYLTYAFLVGSSIYLGLSLLILRRDVKRIKGQHKSWKDQYSDILDPEDLKRIFPDDKLDDISSGVKRQAIWITVAWVSVTLILGSVAFSLHQKEALRPVPPTTETKSTEPTPQRPATSP